MPKPGDGNLWPTTDDDHSSTGPTAELPVPDQPEQAAEPPADSPPAEPSEDTGEPPEAADTTPKGDEPHAPIDPPTFSWPIADLEQKPERAFARPLPVHPASVSNEVTSKLPIPEDRPEPSTEDAPVNLFEPWPPEPDVQQPEPDQPEPESHETEPSSPESPPAEAESTEPEPVETPAEPDEPDPQPDEPETPESEPEDEPSEPEAEADQPVADAPEDDQADAEPPQDAAWPTDERQDEPTEAAADEPRAAAPTQAWPTEAPPEEPRPGADQTHKPDQPPPAKPRERRVESRTVDLGQAAPGWPQNEPRKPRQDWQRPRQTESPTARITPPPETRRDEPPTNFMRPVPPRPPQPPVDAPTSFMRRQDPPSFLRADATPPAETTSIIRPPQQRKTEWPPPEPPRARPERVGPQPEPEEAPPARKKRRPLLITAIAIVAVVGIAAGVIFGVPGLSDKLGITGDEQAAVAPPPQPVAYSPGLKAPDAGSPSPTKQGVESVLAGPISDPALGTVTGVVIDPATGDVLYERDAGTAITPASTGKLLTAAAALLTLDPTYQLVTKVVQGDSPGEAIIVGGGDPTLSSLKPGVESMYPGAAHLSDLVDEVKASGAQIQTVYIDQDRYTGRNMAASWVPADVAAGYITPIVPAMLDGGRADATVNYSPRTSNPGGALVDEFATRIGATAPENAEKKAPANAKVLGEVRSAPLVQLIDNMLDHSDNVLGEILAREVAIKTGKEPSFDGGAQATLDVLRQNGFNVDGVVLKDGSGLSMEDKMSARVLAEVLAMAAAPDGKDPRTAKLRPLLSGLPVAGGSGTLADRYDQSDTQGAKGWLRAKTGSLTGVNSLAGIVLDQDNRPLVFAFLTGDTTSTTARPALDRVSAALRSCGCR